MAASPADDVVDPTTVTPPDPKDVSPASSSPDVKTGTSPEPEKGGTMLDAVKAAIEPKAASPAAETPDAPATSGPTDESADDEITFSPEELKQVSEKVQKRFSQLTSRLKAKDAENASLAPKAKELDNLTGWVRGQGLSDADVRGTLEITGLIRNNPRAALERIRPVMAALEKIVGETLPPELQQRVDQGFLTEQDAKAQARATADASLATRRATALQEQQQAERAASEQKAATDQTLSSVETWEKDKAKGDPDWHLKQGAIAEQVELAILQEATRRGAPWFPTPQEAIKLSEDALKKVDERYTRFVPKPKAITPAIGGASNRTAAEPKSMFDVVKQASAL